MTITKCLRCYDVCKVVGSNLEVICLTKIKLYCRTNRCSSNMGSELELNIAPHALSGELSWHSARLIPTLRCHVAVMTSLSTKISNMDYYS